jgi:uncharacterized membrane protein (UPF0127 family)
VHPSRAISNSLIASVLSIFSRTESRSKSFLNSNKSLNIAGINQIYVKKIKKTNPIFIDMELRVNGKIFPVEMLTNPDDIQQGMMGRESLDGCMGFKLKKGFHSFWMKDCVIPLDIVFVLNNRINKIFRDCQPCSGEECQHFTAAADHVFEFPSGTCSDFNEGDTANLYLGTKYNPV